MCLSRLAGDSEEEWLWEEMRPTAESLVLSGRNIVLVAQKLHLQPGCQSHQEELVTTAQQILVDTTKVRLVSDWLAGRLDIAHCWEAWMGQVIPTVDAPAERDLCPSFRQHHSTEFITNLINAKCGSCHRELLN